MKRTGFKINIEDWAWSDETEVMLARVRDSLADDIVAGLDYSLDVWLSRHNKDGTRGDFRIEAYIYDEASGDSPAQHYSTLTEMIDNLDMDPKEVAYARQAFQHLAEELDTLAKRIFTALEAAKDILDC